MVNSGGAHNGNANVNEEGRKGIILALKVRGCIESFITAIR